MSIIQKVCKQHYAQVTAVYMTDLPMIIVRITTTITASKILIWQHTEATLNWSHAWPHHRITPIYHVINSQLVTHLANYCDYALACLNNLQWTRFIHFNLERCKLCFGNGWGWKSSAVGTDGGGKLISRGRKGMDTVCAVMNGDGLIFHYHAALYFNPLNSNTYCCSKAPE